MNAEEYQVYLVDAELFRFWIDEASHRPGRVASALAGCLTPEDYRVALLALRSMPTQVPKGAH